MPASDDTIMRLITLYRHTDPDFERVLEGSKKLTALVREHGVEQKPTSEITGPNVAQLRAYFTETVGAAAKFLAEPDGPRVGALALDGGTPTSTKASHAASLPNCLTRSTVRSRRRNKIWARRGVKQSSVLVTEFGRTARINGSLGTDHGTATVALLVGGALKGGRVIADWPGLKPAQLLEDRDLKPTTDVRAVLKGLLRDHLRADERMLAADVFPSNTDVKPIAGLVAAA